MHNKTLILLIGPQGAGKSLYCKNLDYVRINQDDQGKSEHFKLFLQAIKEGKNIVVDRINHLRHQRQKYTEIARKEKYKINYVWFDVDRQTCLERLAKRENHPTIRTTDNHDRILAIYFREFEEPQYFEYDKMETIKERKYAKLLDLRQTIGSSRYIVIGDIHGCYDELTALLEQCNYQPNDFVISVGDLMDRGPKSKEVIQWFMTTPNTFVVEGNHDNKARRYWSGRKVKITNGLEKTIEQCKELDTTSIANWIESWPQIIQVPNINKKNTYIVHAGIHGYYPIDKQHLETCYYARYFGGNGFLDESGDIWFTTLDGSYNVISGHMVHENPIPQDYGPIDHVFLLDGGAFQGGTLRAMIVEKGKHEIKEVQSMNYAEPSIIMDGPSIHLSIHQEVEERNKLLEQRLLRCDDKGDLRIYTYTDNCTYESAWTPITLNSRGIILNRTTGEVVARPFSKFFNLGEKEETMEANIPWNSDYIVFEKMDGWLGILYRYENQFHIATRGSFDGNGVAPWATNFLHKNHNLDGLSNDVTLVFEIICPQTKIIVNYNGEEKLILLAAFNRHTGEEYDWTQVSKWAEQYGFALPRVFGKSVDECRKLLDTHKGTELEGFVLRFANGLRVKIKSEDYKRRAAIISNLTPLAIWKAMASDTLNEDYRNHIDADYLEQYDGLVKVLQDQYDILFAKINEEFAEMKKSEYADRKEFALKVQSLGLQHKPMMFALLDGKEGLIRRYILDKIRPNSNILVE